MLTVPDTAQSKTKRQDIAPPLCSPSKVTQTLAAEGFAVLSASMVSELSGNALHALNALTPSWNHLDTDEHLKDAGNYRSRKHASYIISTEHQEDIALQPHRAHWQPVHYNALHGGMERWFSHVDTEIAQSSAIHNILCWLSTVANNLYGAQPWFTELHQFRIDASEGIGRPTPEGAHRDGVNLVAVFLIERREIVGGETRVFHITDRFGQRLTLTEPWSVLLLDDQKVIHESTPIQPQPRTDLSQQIARGAKQASWRDTLVITMRAQSFPAPNS